MLRIVLPHQLLKYSVRVALLGLVSAIFLKLGNGNQTNSLNLTSVSDTLSTSRLSFVARLGAGNSVGSSVIFLDTTQGAYESTSSANLFAGDTVRIGNGAAMGSYTVTGAPSTSSFTTSVGLSSGQTSAGMFVIATRSATHTLAFTSATAIPNGAFRILIPAVSVNANANDGIPDNAGFDFGTSTPTVTCPSDVGSTYDFVTGTASASAVTVGSTKYHSFECRYSGSGSVGQAFTGFTINSLINPAAKINHVEGTSDNYVYIVQNLDYGNATVYDSTSGAVAVVESVRVTATVDPQITFRIGGVASGTSACGVSTGVTTTSATVPFGSVSISSFTNAAQYVTVSTNASNGFAVTTIENDQLGKDGNVCTGAGPTFSNPCIPDSAGDNAAMTSSVSDKWDSTTTKGFAYSLQDPNNSTTEAFSYNIGTGNCSGASFCARKFPDAENSGTAQTIFSGTTVADNQNVYVCYRIVIGTSQQAGGYTNNITYRATATF